MEPVEVGSALSRDGTCTKSEGEAEQNMGANAKAEPSLKASLMALRDDIDRQV